MPEGTCEVEGCDRPKAKRQWCDPHYRAWKKYDDPLGRAIRNADRQCSVDGCESPVKGRGLCARHYRPASVCSEEGCEEPVHGHGLCHMHDRRRIKFGDPQRLKSGIVGVESSRPPGRTAEQRLMARIVVNEVTGCWEWTGAADKHGYGRINIDGHTTLTHRLAWVLHHGEPPPETPHVLHHCDNPACCNPFGDDHLFLGTQADNNADRDAKGRGPARSPCGTPGAYTWHIRHGETPCEPCREAMREYRLELQRRKRNT